ncbi:putative monooxygenase [Methylotuvimicrobium alcaliphilum 20Z]|uniref:Monooxygenase n=2 Tax=Methylotuvimicrobium alcaliphilum TaxID=271065 RepID=G4SZ95_META2|nr:putative monooxygenase [Methylotuvimicrobium alcaliphilum 20Z]
MLSVIRGESVYHIINRLESDKDEVWAFMRQMKLGVFLPTSNSHLSNRRQQGRGVSSWDLSDCQRVAIKAEQAKFDAVFMSSDESLFCHSQDDESVKLLIALTRVTDRIGLVAPACCEYSDPYGLAGSFSALAHISRGRAGWNPGTENNNDRNILTERTRDYIDLVTSLWAMWEVEDGNNDLPEVVDKSNKSDAEVMERTACDHPVLVQNILSDRDIELAARSAEVVLVRQKNEQQARLFYSELKEKAFNFGKCPSQLKIMSCVVPVVAETAEAAHEKYHLLKESLHSVKRLESFNSYLDRESATESSRQQVLPERFNYNGFRNASIEPIKGAMEVESLPLRRLNDCEHRVVIGTAKQVADQLEDWFIGEAADGFAIIPPYFPEGFDDFVDLVVPELKFRNLFRAEYEGATLRDHLGLSRPVNELAKRMIQFSLSYSFSY